MLFPLRIDKKVAKGHSPSLQHRNKLLDNHVLLNMLFTLQLTLIDCRLSLSLCLSFSFSHLHLFRPPFPAKPIAPSNRSTRSGAAAEIALPFRSAASSRAPWAP